jgi:hypothetical protein
LAFHPRFQVADLRQLFGERLLPLRLAALQPGLGRRQRFLLRPDVGEFGFQRLDARRHRAQRRGLVARAVALGGHRVEQRPQLVRGLGALVEAVALRRHRRRPPRGEQPAERAPPAAPQRVRRG